MSTHQLPTHILKELVSIKTELTNAANEFSGTPMQVRLLKVSDNVERLVSETFSQGQTRGFAEKKEQISDDFFTSSVEVEDRVNSSEMGQSDMFLKATSSSSGKLFETGTIENGKSAKRKKHQRGASRHQRVWSMNSAADFEEHTGSNILNEMKSLVPDDASSSDDERDVDKKEVANPVMVSADAGRKWQDQCTGSKDRIVKPVAGKMRETSFGGVFEITGYDNDMKVAKQIQAIVGGSNDELERAHMLLKTSKIDLVKSTAEEISRLRDIIKMLGSQLRQLRVEHNKLLNASFGGQIFGAFASLFSTRK